MDSFLKYVFVRAGKHTFVHDVYPHIISTCSVIKNYLDNVLYPSTLALHRKQMQIPPQ